MTGTMQWARRLAGAAFVGLVLAACGGGGGGGGGGGEPQISAAEAHRFLMQASFGPRLPEVRDLQARGYAAWTDRQLALPVTRQLPYLQGLPQPIDQSDRHEAFLRNAMQGSDQLRQRMAFALSEIFVVSENGALSNVPLGLAAYHDLLAEHAFGNFRELMEAVTLSPAMGVYLSMLGNQKPDPESNIRPDENYARELMQLFTIGLVELEADGTVRRDDQGQPVPTYDQTVIEGFAHVNTGWTFAGSPDFYSPSFDFLHPMQPFEALHDTDAKQLLNGTILPAGGSARQDLEAALNNIFAHDNVPPFIARQLIQRFVTSNPSPAYVGRIAAVFRDDGQGERGNLGAVLKALLLDPEARSAAASDTSGKLQEPVLRLTRLWRAYGASAPNGRFLLPNMGVLIGQAPLAAPSVFNFFQPGYMPSGEFAERGLVAPEMQVTTEFSVALLASILGTYAVAWNTYADDLDDNQVRIDLRVDEPYADTPQRLVTRVAERLTGGAVSPELRGEAEALAAQYSNEQRPFRLVEVVNLFLMSPEYATER